MPTAFLTNPRYPAKDLLPSRYGRLFEIPAGLAALGHEVRGLALSYRHADIGRYTWPEQPRLEWTSINALPLGLLAYTQAFDRLTSAWRPDAIWASSDALHITLASRLSKKYGIPLIVDIYDNYESFKLTRIPGLTSAFRKSCHGANAVTTVTHTLKSRIVQTTRPKGQVHVLGNGVNAEAFHPQDRIICRRQLNLPENGRLIGTTGALNASRGIDDLFKAFMSLDPEQQDIWLVIAGPRDGTVSHYRHPRIIDLGILPWNQVGTAINSLDISIVCNRDSEFGRFCFPLKLQESLACGVPVIAAATGDVTRLMENDPGALYTPGDWRSLRLRIMEKLTTPKLPTLPPPPLWKELASELESVILEVQNKA